jgi:NAD(P)-dependent dehydrogenase (short-subunit alcohol dehydrogenase family)
MSRRVALITGGQGTLAAALREELVSADWLVHAPAKAELDVTGSPAVAAWFERLPRLDLLVNNAGVTRDALFVSQPDCEREAVMEVCLRGAFLCCREAARIMVPRGTGHIVNIGSHSALTGPAGQTAYAAAKAGLIALTKSLAAELGPHNIRVNAVLPGWMETNMTAPVTAAVRQRALDAHVLGRFNTPAEAARFIAFLHSMSAVSGQVFSLDSRLTRGGL